MSPKRTVLYVTGVVISVSIGSFILGMVMWMILGIFI